MSVHICENSQMRPALRKQGEYNELGGAPQTPNILCFVVLLRKMESCAYQDSDPRTAIVCVFDFSENHILRRCFEAWVLQKMENISAPLLTAHAVPSILPWFYIIMYPGTRLRRCVVCARGNDQMCLTSKKQGECTEMVVGLHSKYSVVFRFNTAKPKNPCPPRRRALHCNSFDCDVSENHIPRRCFAAKVVQ